MTFWTPPFVEPRELISIPASLPGENIKTRSEKLLSPLQQAIKRANDEGEHIPGFSGIYPVFENAQQQRYYEPLPFKQLKELKMACAQYGPTVPFTFSWVPFMALGWILANMDGGADQTGNCFPFLSA